MPGAAVPLTVSVRNTSPVVWPNDWFVTLGNHWRGSGGEMLRLDDGRASLGAPLHPGEAIELRLVARAPADPGTYLLELDLVVEGVSWFSDRGSPTVTLPVRVASTHAAMDDESLLEPVMEIHGIPRANVESELRRGGLDLRAVRETDKADGWHDYWYVAVKPDADARE